MSQPDTLALEHKISERRFPSKYIETLVPLLVAALDIIERKRVFNTGEVSNLIDKLFPYSRENIADKCRHELIDLYQQEKGEVSPKPAITKYLLRRPKSMAGQ